MPGFRNLHLLICFLLLTGLSCGNSSNQGGDPPREEAAKTGTGLQHDAEELFSRYVCMTCHSFEGKRMYGPGLDSIYQKEITVIRDGKELRLTVDRTYLERSILDPDFEKVKGYENTVMPVPDMPREHALLLVEYIIKRNTAVSSE